MAKRFILASGSPRRKELLSRLTAEFQVEPSFYEERPCGLSARETVLLFAEGKAREVFSRFPEAFVLGADTAVCLGEEIFGKPRSEEHAKEMLSRLSGKTHDVFTGVCLIGQGIFLKDVVKTRVTFRTLTREEIADYVESGLSEGKAGAYGIQDGILTESYTGSYTNVVGLPLETVEGFLKKAGICGG